VNTNFNRRKFIKLSSGAVAGGAVGLSGLNSGCSGKEFQANARAIFTKGYHFQCFQTPYPDIPRIEGHSHIGPWSYGKENDSGAFDRFSNCFVIRDLLLAYSDIDVALWIDLNNTPIEMINQLGRGRIATTISDYRPAAGLSYTPEDIAAKLREGFIGYKLHFGEQNKYNLLYPYIDDPFFEPVLAAMEKEGMVITCAHMENQWHEVNGKWKLDNTWRQQEAIENVLQRHPGLTFVQAHFAKLRDTPTSWNLQRIARMFANYPNYYLDISCSFNHFRKIDYDELRNFFIQHSDRLIFGTDAGAGSVSTFSLTNLSRSVREHAGMFALLETDEEVSDMFWGLAWPTKGLALPREVLVEIYNGNALKVYPQLAEMMNRLGYSNAGRSLVSTEENRSVILLTSEAIRNVIGINTIEDRRVSIPRIDVNTHIRRNGNRAIPMCFAIRDLVLANSGRDIAMWINLDGEIERFKDWGQGRIASTICDYKPARGLCFSPDDIGPEKAKGYLGYTLHFGILNKWDLSYPFIDEPAYAPVLEEMEKQGMVLASVYLHGGWHIEGREIVENTNEQFEAFERVLQRHPGLVVVVAHCGGFGKNLNQEAIKELTRLCSTYKNYHVDLADVFRYVHLADRAALREFMIRFSDRILYGSDTGFDGINQNSSLSLEGLKKSVEDYIMSFDILETGREITGGFLGRNTMQGLDLPAEALDNIYYGNALRVYPQLAGMMKKKGYNL
jgi:predicted TIM-barrel fold metal-dependent hydrolase